jgi:uncharacterized protein
MNQQTFKTIESFLNQHLKDSAHDRQHVDRVLYTALDIAAHEENVNYDVLIAACLLHDVARPLEAPGSDVCHARAGGANMSKFGNTAEKMRPLVDQLFPKG